MAGGSREALGRALGRGHGRVRLRMELGREVVLPGTQGALFCEHSPALSSTEYVVPTFSKSFSIPRGDCRVCHWLFVPSSGVTHIKAQR